MEIYKNKSHVLVHHVFPKTVSSCLLLERHIKSIIPLGHLNCNSLGHPELLKCWPVTLRHPGGATKNLIQYSRKVSKLSDGIWIFGYPSPCQANPAKNKNTRTQNHIIDFKQKPFKPWQQFLSIKVGWITHKAPNFRELSLCEANTFSC